MKTMDVSYLVDEQGKKTSVVIPLSLLQKMDFEDLYDVVIAKDRLKNDEFVEFE